MRTFSDQVQQLVDTFTITSNTDRIGRLSRAAVRSAYNDLPTMLRWNYLLRRTQINTATPYSTGTITYDSDTRTITLDSGSFPTWAASGEILISRNVYSVEQRVNSTTLILASDRCPLDDITDDTAYTLVQTKYNLPVDFTELRAIVELERLWPITFLPPEEMLQRTQLWFDPSDILFFTIIGGVNGRVQIQFAPPPVVARTYDVIYQAKPRPFGLNGAYSTGTATTTADSTTVNFSGSTLPLNVKGCVLRIAADDLKLPESDVGDNPSVEEHVILSRVSATQVLLETAATSSYTAVKFTIDDPIDIEPVAMRTLLDRMCESRMLRLHQSDIQRMGAADIAESMALHMAMQSDARLIPKAMQGSLPVSMHDMLFGVTPRES